MSEEDNEPIDVEAHLITEEDSPPQPGHRDKKKEKEIEDAPNWPFNLKVLGIFAIAIATIFGLILGTNKTMGINYDPWEIFKGFSIFSLFYFIGSWRIVRGEQERAGIVILGYIDKHVVGRGLVWIPLGLGQVIPLRRSVIQKELPDEPERVWTFLDEKGLERPIPEDQTDKFKLPIRVTFKSDDPSDKEEPLKKGAYLYNKIADNNGDEGGSKDPMKARLAVRVTLVMRFRIVDPIRFLKTFRTEEEAKEQLEDIVISEATAALQVGTYARALANIAGLGRLITDNVLLRLALDPKYNMDIENDRPSRAELIEIVADHWGIAAFSVQIKAFGASRSLNDKVQRIAEAVAEKLSAQEEAIGTIAKTAAVYEGQAQGLKAFDAEAEKHKEILAIDAMKEGMKQGTVIIGGDSVMQSLIGTFKAVKKIEETQEGGDR